MIIWLFTYIKNINSNQSQETEKNRFFGSLSVLKTDNRTENEKTEKIGFLDKTDTEKPKINRNQKRKKR
jgi:hypothetical protein